MKRISFWLAVGLIGVTPLLQAQDAATEERLNKLAGQIDNLMEGQKDLQNKIETLSREIAGVREQASKPTGNYAAHEDLVRLGEKLREVDQKRIADAEKVSAELISLRNSLLKMPAPAPRPKPAVTPPANVDNDKPARPEKGFEYVVRKNDNLDLILQAYREKNIKVTRAQVLKANPGLKPDKLLVGQKIFIPAPQP
jgi:hypothetical protein